MRSLNDAVATSSDINFMCILHKIYYEREEKFFPHQMHVIKKFMFKLSLGQLRSCLSNTFISCERHFTNRIKQEWEQFQKSVKFVSNLWHSQLYLSCTSININISSVLRSKYFLVQINQIGSEIKRHRNSIQQYINNN